MKPLVVTILALFAMTAPAFAGGDDAAPKCREGIYGTWYPYNWGASKLVGKLIVENDRIWFENEGAWIDYRVRKTQEGFDYFIPQNQLENELKNEKGFYFAIRNPARLGRLASIPCAVELIQCAHEDWIVAAVENNSDSHPSKGGPIAGGDVYCGHYGFTPTEIPGVLERP